MFRPLLFALPFAWRFCFCLVALAPVAQANDEGIRDETA